MLMQGLFHDAVLAEFCFKAGGFYLQSFQISSVAYFEVDFFIFNLSPNIHLEEQGTLRIVKFKLLLLLLSSGKPWENQGNPSVKRISKSGSKSSYYIVLLQSFVSNWLRFYLFLCFSTPHSDGQPKKVRKVPPGLPSSVSYDFLYPSIKVDQESSR